VCPNCHNQVFLHLVRSKKSVRLYFVPVVPYGTEDYLVCPVCSRGLQISSAQVHQVRSMGSTTASFRAGRVPEDRYQARVERFWRQLGMNPGSHQRLTPARTDPSPLVQAAPPARSAAPAADDRPVWIAQLHELAQLHGQGLLSDAAYADAKRRVLEQDKHSGPPAP
jgi:uncharacterized protein YbaR (Trm112 family)